MTATANDTSVVGDFVDLLGETYYQIQNYDTMPPFFMTVVSAADHWLFIASTGGLTAGRINPNHALFPYYTVDRIKENANNTGSKSFFHLSKHGKIQLWEPFIDRLTSPYAIDRTLYKNIAGTSLVFEEINTDLGLTFRYAWRTSDRYGIIKTGWLINHDESAVSVTITDGIQNILPAHVDSDSQNRLSVLLDAYKRNELIADNGLGLYYLSSRLTDLAEPSESLRANTVWQVGLENGTYLVSSSQINTLRAGHSAKQESDVRGERGAYFVHTTIELAPNAEKSWHIVSEVDQDSAAIARLKKQLSAESGSLYYKVKDDIAITSNHLEKIVGGADGVQLSADPLSTGHHFANVLFNVMRGGTFFDQYQIDKVDFIDFVDTHHSQLRAQHRAFFDDLPETFSTQMLKARADAQSNNDVIRLCYTYLPLTFSRRHGDPSRPWNRFSIHLKNVDGSPQLNYEGNWRDIFQNWEALAYAYPEFIDGMISVFLNATTPDGYNPYRITRDGIDWEAPDPDDPWANIGYWSDHQIIYLQKLMEVCERFYPGKLQDLLTRTIFTYADVPYRIKPYDDIVSDPYDTIEFDDEHEHAITTRVQKMGTDGKLLLDSNGNVVHTTLIEKLLNLLLAKLVNFVPAGGIWMNTQRPEWNDANNALVGKGLSVVTTSYLRRYIVFLQTLIADAPDELALSDELTMLFEVAHATLADYQSSDGPISNKQRRSIMDALGRAGSEYRWLCYEKGYSGDLVNVTKEQLTDFLSTAQGAIDRTIEANRRDDGLYHAYNTLQLRTDMAHINHLYPMLEGQVAVLSSGALSPDAVLTLLRELRQSVLYREDQHSYILYPDRELPDFTTKNTIDETLISGLALVQTLVEKQDTSLIVKDVNGDYHFAGDLRNVRDVRDVLETLSENSELEELVEENADSVMMLFEKVFEHDTFTGRSGSFFAYEGLGSVYWHMVSKLLLAIQENIYLAQATQSEALPLLIKAYYDVRNGLGFNKSPDVYGAFPLDPYSHTPRDKGAKQPGMTGMVKEEILTRIGELGIVIANGEIVFNPILLRDEELLNDPSVLHYRAVDNTLRQIDVPAGSVAFTLCRVPFIVEHAEQNQFTVKMNDDTSQIVTGYQLGYDLSQHIFSHDGAIRQVTVGFTETTGTR